MIVISDDEEESSSFDQDADLNSMPFEELMDFIKKQVSRNYRYYEKKIESYQKEVEELQKKLAKYED